VIVFTFLSDTTIFYNVILQKVEFTLAQRHYFSISLNQFVIFALHYLQNWNALETILWYIT